MPISHRKYLKRVANLTRILRTRVPSAVAFAVISHNPRHTDLFRGIQEHCEAYCTECMLEDEAYDRAHASEDRDLDTANRIPDEEGVLLAAGLDWIRLTFPMKRTAEVLMADLDLCKALRSVVMKYHPTRLPHEAESVNKMEMAVMLNQALDRLWPALRDFVPEPPPSRVTTPQS